MQNEIKKVSTFKIAATYIGTVIGAGFASGQEILQFFGAFGRMGLAGIFIVTVCFILYGYIIMELGFIVQSHSYLEIIRLSGGKIFGIAADSIISFFLFGALATMIAASGALFYEQFAIPSFIGGIIITALTVLIVFMGMNGLINSLSIIVPVLLTVAVGTSVISLYSEQYNQFRRPVTIASNTLMGNWAWSALLYISYNIVTAVAVLAPLGKEAKNKKAILNGSIIAGLALGACALAIYAAEFKNLSSLENIELPMLFIASSVSPVLRSIYAVILLAGIFSTSVGSLYGFASRVTDIDGPKGRILIPVIAVLAYFAGQFGFSNLVKFMYPIEGYLGMLLLAGLLYSELKLGNWQRS